MWTNILCIVFKLIEKSEIIDSSADIEKSTCLNPSAFARPFEDVSPKFIIWAVESVFVNITLFCCSLKVIEYLKAEKLLIKSTNSYIS